MSGRRVYNDKLREAVLRWLGEGNNWSDLARKLGWMKEGKVGDTSRIKRALGLQEMHSYKDGQRYTYFSKNIGEDNALAIVRAIGRAPNEFDL